MNNLFEILEEDYTPSEIVEILDSYDESQLEDYALSNDICPKCYGNLLRHEYKEYRGEHFGFPAYENMVGCCCESCGEVFE